MISFGSKAQLFTEAGKAIGSLSKVINSVFALGVMATGGYVGYEWIANDKPIVRTVGEALLGETDYTRAYMHITGSLPSDVKAEFEEYFGDSFKALEALIRENKIKADSTAVVSDSETADSIKGSEAKEYKQINPILPVYTIATDNSPFNTIQLQKK
ncbi:MAG: hypothetical protein LIP09_09840 [Bacteroidales bacterium]|nr:hypothetical protein [Bacteroidales bacterium]